MLGENLRGVVKEVGFRAKRFNTVKKSSAELYEPRRFMTNSDRFRKIVNEVKKNSFNPVSLKFVIAFQAVSSMSKSTWEKKVEVYKKWGCSEDEILVAFEKYLWCMMASEHKIMRLMEFFVNKMGYSCGFKNFRLLERYLVPCDLFRCVKWYQSKDLPGSMAQDRVDHANPTDGDRRVEALWVAYEKQQEQLNEIRDLLIGLNLNANNRPPMVDRVRAEGVTQGQPVNQNRVRTEGFARDSSFLARRLILIGHSLEKRIVPRCAVYQVLLSKEKAISTSSYVKFETPNKPDSELVFLENHGFTKTQNSNLVRKYPPVILCDPEKTLLPKFQFFKSKGISSTDVVQILSSEPSILKRSLENKIIPSFNFLEKLMGSQEEIIKRFARVLVFDLQVYVVPNIEILREASVPNANIVWLRIFALFATNIQRRYSTYCLIMTRPKLSGLEQYWWTLVQLVEKLPKHGMGWDGMGWDGMSFTANHISANHQPPPLFMSQ
ncbi:hypothetical protein TEA_027617 [Camellia sinensis var. sinensis]|uniref:Uncharacterized protein n=1 Tax=Camellia sinensis var. sinensis TaxID=542762 RepID=A0A4S4EWI4_CAMSN|nr:hypothetical protein TEA_027617 [Camellia sinensis var. sinensis]